MSGLGLLDLLMSEPLPWGPELPPAPPPPPFEGRSVPVASADCSKLWKEFVDVLFVNGYVGRDDETDGEVVLLADGFDFEPEEIDVEEETLGEDSGVIDNKVVSPENRCKGSVERDKLLEGVVEKPDGLPDADGTGRGKVGDDGAGKGDSGGRVDGVIVGDSVKGDDKDGAVICVGEVGDVDVPPREGDGELGDPKLAIGKDAEGVGLVGALNVEPNPDGLDVSIPLELFNELGPEDPGVGMPLELLDDEVWIEDGEIMSTGS